ncbi:MAG: type II toxin-antitoxin system RelE/ParE family toxin [Nitrosospira sp.]
MIKNFKCKYTEKLYCPEFVKRFSGFDRQAAKRLRILDSADTLDALKTLPSNAFKALLGNRAGQYSIRVNMQWRIYFTWNEGAENVEILDYH